MDVQFVSFERYCNLKKYKKIHDKTIYKTFNELQKYKDTKGNIIDELSLFDKYISECTKDNKELILNKNSMEAKDIKSKEEKKAKQGRLNMLTDKHKAHVEKIRQVKLTRKQKILKELEHFKLAQERRNEKKLQRRQMYLSKGGVQLPKAKSKVEVRPIIEQLKKQDSSKHRYIVRTQYINQSSIIGDSVGAIVCLPDKLKDVVKYSFKKMMEKESDKVVGYFIYDSDNPEVCIMEMVSSKYREIDGVTITRLQKQDKTAA